MCIRNLPVLLMVCLAVSCARETTPPRVRDFAKLPDWSGLWDSNSNASVGASDAGSRPKSAEDLRKEAEAAAASRPPYNAEWQSRVQAAAGKPGNQPVSSGCLANGFPTIMTGLPPQMFAVLITPELTAFLFAEREVRYIYTDGRSHPPKGDQLTSAWGDSIGHWEGDTLVVDTVATRQDIGFKANRLPVSDQVHFAERIRSTGKDEIENQLTIEDPLAFTRPWQRTFTYRRVTDVDRMIQEDCAENDRNPVVNGQFSTILN